MLLALMFTGPAAAAGAEMAVLDTIEDGTAQSQDATDPGTAV
jgi:hypothetical protein